MALGLGKGKGYYNISVRYEKKEMVFLFGSKQENSSQDFSDKE